MRVDEYRLRKGPKDNAPKCKDDNCRLLIAKHLARPLMHHRVSTKGCLGYEDYRLNILARGTTTHSPFQHSETECPF